LVARVISARSTPVVAAILAGLMLATTSGAQSRDSQVWVTFPSGTKVSVENTLIALDILWLNGRGVLLSIAHAIPPCAAEPCPHYSPEAEACAVVEVRAGFAKQHDVKVGDIVKFGGLTKPPRCR
jgi:uncharacterized protein